MIYHNIREHEKKEVKKTAPKTRGFYVCGNSQDYQPAMYGS